MSPKTTGMTGGWFLPSLEALNQMYTQLHLSGLGSFGQNSYLSSSEVDAVNVWYKAFTNGYQGTRDKDFVFRVRAIRAF